MIRVLLLFTSSELGGAERSLTRMALCSEEIEYQLATLGGEGAWVDWMRDKGVEPLRFGPAGSVATSLFGGAVWRVVEYIRRSSIDIVYICGTRATFALRLLRPLLSGVKLVHGIRWNPASASRLDRFFRLAERHTRWLVDGWVANSHVAAVTLSDSCHVPRDRIQVIYNGIGTPSSLPSVDRTVDLLTVANLSPRKGHRTYLEVLQELHLSYPHLRCVFAGRDDMNGAVQREICRTGLRQVVEYVGFQRNLSQWYAGTKILVLPSRWGEGCPTVILEAFAHGVPVVAFRIDGIPELVTHGVDGLLVPSGDDAGFAAAIRTLLDDERKAIALGAAGRAKVTESFGVRRCADDHRDYFTGLITEEGVSKCVALPDI